MKFGDHQDSIWSPVLLQTGSFSHLNKQYYAKDVAKTKIRSKPNDLFYVSSEDALGVIFAYKYLSEPKPKVVEEKEYLDDDISFSPMRQDGNSLASSALLDILHNMGINILPLARRRSKKCGRLSSFIVVDDTSENSSSSDKSETNSYTDTYHFVSYIYKNNNLIELDGDTLKPIAIEEFLEKDDQVDWISSLVSYLEDRIKGEGVEVTCATIMRKPNFQEKIVLANASIQQLEEELEEHITSNEGRIILERIQKLREEIRGYKEKLLTEHGVWQHPHRFTSKRRESDSAQERDSERRVSFDLPSETDTSSSGSTTNDDGSSFVVIEGDQEESDFKFWSTSESPVADEPEETLFTDTLSGSSISIETGKFTDESYEEEQIETTESDSTTEGSSSSSSSEEGRGDEGTVASEIEIEVTEPEDTDDIEEDEVRTSVKRKNEDDEKYKSLPPKKRFTRG